MLDTQGGWSRRRHPSSAQATRRSRMKDASDSCDESLGQPCHQSPPRLTPNERFAARQAIPLRRTLTRGIAMRHHLLLASGLALLLAACGDPQPEQPATPATATDRKSAVKGKSVYCRVYLGGRRL